MMIAEKNAEEDEVEKILEEIETYGIISPLGDDNSYIGWISFTSKEDYGINDTVYFYSLQKKYLYKFNTVQNSEGEGESKFTYIESGTDKIGEELLTKALNLKKHLEDIFIGKTVEEIRQYDSNTMEAYIKEEYEVNLTTVEVSPRRRRNLDTNRRFSYRY